MHYASLCVYLHHELCVLQLLQMDDPYLYVGLQTYNVQINPDASASLASGGGFVSDTQCAGDMVLSSKVLSRDSMCRMYQTAWPPATQVASRSISAVNKSLTATTPCDVATTADRMCRSCHPVPL